MSGDLFVDSMLADNPAGFLPSIPLLGLGSVGVLGCFRDAVVVVLRQKLRV